jgi:hypothetical protein
MLTYNEFSSLARELEKHLDNGDFPQSLRMNITELLLEYTDLSTEIDISELEEEFDLETIGKIELA